MTSFNPSYKGIGELLCSPMIVKEMRRRAEKVKAAAEAIAPDAPPFGQGYIADFEVESGIREGRTRRAFGRVKNTSPHAFYVEFGGRAWGGKKTPRHRTLGRALDSAK